MNTRNFNKKTGAALLALVLMALLPLGGLAVTASLPEYGLTVPFPGSLDVFTQQMDPGDPLLKLYGTVIGEKQSLDLGNMRTSAGVELRIFVPVFGAPLRFIYSVNLNELPYDSFETFRFSIGATF